MPWKKKPIKKLTIPIAKKVIGTTGTKPHPKASCAIMPANKSPKTSVKSNRAKAPHLANKSETSRTGVASRIPWRFAVRSRHIISAPKKTMMIIIGRAREFKATWVMNRDVGSVVLAPMNMVTSKTIPNRAKAIPTNIMKAVLRTVVRYSNFKRVQKALSVNPAFKSGATGSTRFGISLGASSKVRLPERI